MEVQERQKKLLKKRSSLLVRIADCWIIIEEQAFYSIKGLEQEVKNLEQYLLSLKRLSLKYLKEVEK